MNCPNLPFPSCNSPLESAAGGVSLAFHQKLETTQVVSLEVKYKADILCVSVCVCVFILNSASQLSNLLLCM